MYKSPPTKPALHPKSPTESISVETKLEVNCYPPTLAPTFGDRSKNRKWSDGISHRVASLEDTLARVLAKRDLLGITRIGNITNVDNLRIPNYSVISPLLNFPSSPGMISVMSGKGITLLHAKVSALMETVERYSCIKSNNFSIQGSYSWLSKNFNVAHPSDFIVPDSFLYDNDQPMEWVHSQSLFHGDLVLVPACLVFTPYRTTEATTAFSSSTNGLASGNTIEEAALHALLELIERDAEAIALNCDLFSSLDLEKDLPESASELLGRFAQENVDIEVKYITQGIDVAVFLTIIVDKTLASVKYINGGKGAHLDPEIALLRSLTEASQSRVVGMTGIREDMPKKRGQMDAPDFQALLTKESALFGRSPKTINFSEIRNRASNHITDDLDYLFSELRKIGTPDVYLIDLTRKEIGIPVARVLVPGLEFEVPGNWCGPRLQECLKRKNDSDLELGCRS